MTPAKPWYRSRTVWFNILTIGGAVMGGVVGLLPTIEPLFTPMAYMLTLFVVGVGNVVLRALTSGPIDWKDEDASTD